MMTRPQTAVCTAVSPTSGSPTFDIDKKNIKTERGEFKTPSHPTGRQSNNQNTAADLQMFLNYAINRAINHRKHTNNNMAADHVCRRSSKLPNNSALQLNLDDDLKQIIVTNIIHDGQRFKWISNWEKLKNFVKYI